jgi:hypothetical protein
VYSFKKEVLIGDDDRLVVAQLKTSFKKRILKYDKDE